MSGVFNTPLSIRRRLTIQFIVVSLVLAALLYWSVRQFSESAAEGVQDNILYAAASSIADSVRMERGAAFVDLPYSSLSMLDNSSDDRVFYRVAINGETVTGYHELGSTEMPTIAGTPTFSDFEFLGSAVRAVTLTREILDGSEQMRIVVYVAQTRGSLSAISERTSLAAAGIGVGFFILAAALSILAANSALRPINRLASAVQNRRGNDLSPFTIDSPKEVVPLMTALNSFTERLRTNLSRSETFLAEAAHRIRTPLATVRTQSEIALRNVEKAENRKILRAVIRAADETSRSAGQLLEHAMIGLRSDQMSMTKINMANLVSEVIRDISATADLKDIWVDQKLEPCTVPGDRVMLDAAIRNLLDNAIKYSSEESTVSVTLECQTEGVKLSVSDEGRGLDATDDTKIFQRFSRGKNVGQIIGSGLGLTIVREVAAAHGGSISLTGNKGGVGACAVLYLPSSH